MLEFLDLVLTLGQCALELFNEDGELRVLNVCIYTVVVVVMLALAAFGAF